MPANPNPLWKPLTPKEILDTTAQTPTLRNKTLIALWAETGTTLEDLVGLNLSQTGIEAGIHAAPVCLPDGRTCEAAVSRLLLSSLCQKHPFAHWPDAARIPLFLRLHAGRGSRTLHPYGRKRDPSTRVDFEAMRLSPAQALRIIRQALGRAGLVQPTDAWPAASESPEIIITPTNNVQASWSGQ